MIPGTLAHYRIQHSLGGGMGEVYLADDTKLHRKVALEVLLDHAAADPECRERLTREARAAALSHPNIVTIHSVEEDAARRSHQETFSQSMRRVPPMRRLSDPMFNAPALNSYRVIR